MVTLFRWLDKTLYGSLEVQRALKPSIKETARMRRLVIIFGSLIVLLMSVGWLGRNFIMTPWFIREWPHSLLLIKINHLSFYSAVLYFMSVIGISVVSKRVPVTSRCRDWIGISRLILYLTIATELMIKMTGYYVGLWLILKRGWILLICYYALPVTSSRLLNKVEPLWLLLYRSCMWWSHAPGNIGVTSVLDRYIDHLLHPAFLVNDYVWDGFMLVSYRYTQYFVELFFLFMAVWLLKRKGEDHAVK